MLGTTSMIIWALTWLLVLKYSFIVLCADDNGQGARSRAWAVAGRHACRNILAYFQKVKWNSWHSALTLPQGRVLVPFTVIPRLLETRKSK